MEVSPRRKRVSCFFRGNSWRRDETMSKKPVTHRVVTFLTREELDFLDKLEKDVMFSSGKYISRSQILQDMAELLAKTKMNATGIKNKEQKLKSLYTKGGIMLFAIERPNRLYKGTIMLSPVENCCQRRAVYVREYVYRKNDSNNKRQE